MININIYKHNNMIIGFEAIGHAGYAKNGKDIICAATSVLFLTTINSLENLTDAKIEYKVDDGYAKCKVMDEPDSETQLLFESLLIGLTGILETYKKKYINLKFEEV